jgi:two-component system sensor histidine kinase/response regulator
VTITTNNIARFTNPRIEEMFALRVGSSVPDLYVYPEQRSALLDELSRKGIVRDFGVQFRGSNGEIRDCLFTLIHMEYEGQQGLLGWIVDVTELTKIQTALSEAKVAAEDATKAKAEFLANMSHEIRTPMNAVIGLAHLCLRTDLTVKQRDYVGKIHNAGTSLLSIINDILDFSKIEAGKLDIENVAFQFDSVMNNISTMVAQKIQDKGLELLFDISSDIPPALLGDPLRLGQVFINLLGNAVKFTERGEIRLIGELLERTGDKVKLRFSVKDTGIGMTKEQASRLFQAFLKPILRRRANMAELDWAGHLQASGGADGRLYLGCQRAGWRKHFQLYGLVRPVESDRAQGLAHAARIAQGACGGRQCLSPGGVGGTVKNHWRRNRTGGIGRGSHRRS